MGAESVSLVLWVILSQRGGWRGGGAPEGRVQGLAGIELPVRLCPLHKIAQD